MTDASEIPATDLFDETFFSLASECTVEAWLNFLGHRWNALILYHLAVGPKRFKAIGECLPTATPKVLTERLSALTRAGLVERTSSDREAAYRLTLSGKQLMPILNSLEVWARDASPASDAGACEKLVER
jgi:DNA-binding HxlR family transcriptional regulator